MTMKKRMKLKLQIDVSDGITTIKQDVWLRVTRSERSANCNFSFSKYVVIEYGSTRKHDDCNNVYSQPDTMDNHNYDLAIGNGFNDEGNTYFKISENHLILSKSFRF